MSETLEALRRANPRTRAGFTDSVQAAADAVHAQIAAAPLPGIQPSQRRRRRALFPVAGAGLTALAAAAALATVGSLGGGPSVENAIAAVRKAASVTAASAERSGTAVVRMTHQGQDWAGKTVRWNGPDLSIVEDAGPHRSRGAELRVVDGLMYGPDPRGGWVNLGSPESIDPGSGTTPDEHLAAVREDIGGVTLRRITGGMTGLRTSRLADGSAIYRGKVAAGLIARETGFKEGEAIRVLPFGYVAHDDAADPAAPLDVSVTVGTDGIVREIAVAWGTWTYRVAYSNLGATPAPTAPENARALRDRTPGVPDTR